MRFLGFTVSDLGISTDASYMREVSEFPSPNDHLLSQSKKVSRVLELCGMVGYYRRFARSLGTLEKPLRALTLKDAPWIWTDECQAAFEEIKKSLCSAPVLAHPDFSLLNNFIISTDAIRLELAPC